MNRENAKKFLRRAYKIDERIAMKTERLEDGFPSVTQVMDPANIKKTGAGIHAYENQVVNYISEYDKLRMDIERLYNIRKEVRSALDLLENTDEYILLDMRYLQGASFMDIAQKINMTRRNAYRVHDRALDSMCEIIGVHYGEV